VHAEGEGSARGRLPDGRAFRTDAQGNQLVDYIAELELSVEQLNRRVHGLEFEVEERQREIDRLSRSGGSAAGVAERDLLRTQPQKNSPRADSFAMAGLRQETSEAASDCSAEVAATQQLLEKTRFDLDVARKVQEKSSAEYEDAVEKLRTQYSRQVTPKLDCSVEVAKVSAAMRKSQQELEQTQAAIEAERGAQQKRIADYEQNLRQLRAELATRDTTVRDLETKLAAARVAKPAVEAISVAAAAPEESRELGGNRTVSLEVSPQQSRVLPSHQEFARGANTRGTLDQARFRAVDSLRGTMMNDINRLRDLIASRDSLYKSFDQSGRALKFKPSPLVSGRGFTLGVVTERIKSANSVHELSPLSRDIREIRARVQDDIALIKRMQR
jgi:hypothetical protein